MVLWSIENSWGGEILVPKIPSYRIIDVARAVGPNCDYPVVGVRPGEKIHEEMITVSDSYNTVDLGTYFSILPSGSSYTTNNYCEKRRASPVPKDFCYNSGTNSEFLTVEQLRQLIRSDIDPTV